MPYYLRYSHEKAPGVMNTMKGAGSNFDNISHPSVCHLCDFVIPIWLDDGTNVYHDLTNKVFCDGIQR